MSGSVMHGYEKVALRTSKKDRECFTWAERDGASEPQCTRIIGAGEEYVASTIYPGHDSGFADEGSRLRFVWNSQTKTHDKVREVVPAAPVTSHFCLPCCDRWLNLRDALAEIRGAA